MTVYHTAVNLLHAQIKRASPVMNHGHIVLCLYSHSQSTTIDVTKSSRPPIPNPRILLPHALVLTLLHDPAPIPLSNHAPLLANPITHILQSSPMPPRPKIRHSTVRTCITQRRTALMQMYANPAAHQLMTSVSSCTPWRQF